MSARNDNIPDDAAVASILDDLREFEERTMAAHQRKAEERERLRNAILNELRPGTYFDGLEAPMSVQADGPLLWSTLPLDSPRYPVPLDRTHTRHYSELEFKYTIKRVSATFPFFVCASSLLDLRFRRVDHIEDKTGCEGYATEWILVAIPKSTLRTLCDLVIAPLLVDGEDFQTVDTSNFIESDDGEYATTTASLEVDPSLVHIEIGEDRVTKIYRGHLHEIYSRKRSGIHYGFLIFDPYLLVDIADEGPSDDNNDTTVSSTATATHHSCQLKLRLCDIRSSGETQDADHYFPQLDEDITLARELATSSFSGSCCF